MSVPLNRHRYTVSYLTIYISQFYQPNLFVYHWFHLYFHSRSFLGMYSRCKCIKTDKLFREEHTLKEKTNIKGLGTLTTYAYVIKQRLFRFWPKQTCHVLRVCFCSQLLITVN